MRPNNPVLFKYAAVAAIGLLISVADAPGAVVIVGGPTYDSTTDTGSIYQVPFISTPEHNVLRRTASNGAAVASVSTWDQGNWSGIRAVRVDASGIVTVLGDIGLDASGNTQNYALAANATGTSVGWGWGYVGGIGTGRSAIRWDASGAATELGRLGSSSEGVSMSYAFAVNDAGTAAGLSQKYSPDGALLGNRAVRWNASGTAATELGNLGTNIYGETNASANAINASGTAVGPVSKYVAGVYKGTRVVRWDGGGTVATELGYLGTTLGGDTVCNAFAINDTGTAVGHAFKSGFMQDDRAVRWDANSTAATELGSLSLGSSGQTQSRALAINAAGTAVGWAQKYVDGDSGTRAVRWDASGTAATELGHLGTSGGHTDSRALAINDTGIAVGWAIKYDEANFSGDSHAVLWDIDGVATDLNTLLSPADASLWMLREAHSISDGNWVSGYGDFDPDGVGGQGAYARMFLVQVPEPAGLGVLAMAGLAMRRRRR